VPRSGSGALSVGVNLKSFNSFMGALPSKWLNSVLNTTLTVKAVH